MNQNSFDAACDLLSSQVDQNQFDRLHWDRTRAPMLARLVTLAKSALESRPEFELAEEGSTRDIKRFVLKVHSNRVVAVAVGLDNERAMVGAEAIDRSRFRLTPGAPVSVDYGSVDQDWMSKALQELFSRIHS